MDQAELQHESENAEWFYRVALGGIWEDFDTLQEVYDYITNNQKKGMYCSIRHLAQIADKKEDEEKEGNKLGEN